MGRKTSGMAGAVALALASGAGAVEFDVGEDSTFAVGGELQLLYLLDERRSFDDPDESLDEDPPRRSGDEGVFGVEELIDNGSALIVEGDTRLADGLTGYFALEWNFTADQDDGGLNETSESIFGLAGRFGAVQIGNGDGIYEDAISDVLNPFEYEGPTSFDFSGDHGDQLTYFSPDVGNVSFAVQTVLKGDGEGIDTDAADPSDERPGRRADTVNPLVLVASYTGDGYEVHLGYDDRALVSDQADPQTGLGVIVEFEPVTLALKYETVGDSRDNARDGLSATMLIATYSYEPRGSVALAVQQIAYDHEVPLAREDRSEVVINAFYRLGEDLYFFAEAAEYDLADGLGDYTGIGAVYSF